MRPERASPPLSCRLFPTPPVRTLPGLRAVTSLPNRISSGEETAIRGQRSAFNDALVHRDLSAIDNVLHADYLVMPSFATNCVDKPAILDVYKSYFADPDFVTFERTPDRILIGGNQRCAAETGGWAGLWKSDSGGKRNRSGIYQAEWRLSERGWKLMRESYVLLDD